MSWSSDFCWRSVSPPLLALVDGLVGAEAGVGVRVAARGWPAISPGLGPWTGGGLLAGEHRLHELEVVRHQLLQRSSRGGGDRCGDRRGWRCARPASPASRCLASAATDDRSPSIWRKVTLTPKRDWIAWLAWVRKSESKPSSVKLALSSSTTMPDRSRTRARSFVIEFGEAVGGHGGGGVVARRWRLAGCDGHRPPLQVRMELSIQ